MSSFPQTLMGRIRTKSSIFYIFRRFRRAFIQSDSPAPSGAVRVRRLAQGHLDATSQEEPGIELATLRLPANPRPEPLPSVMALAGFVILTYRPATQGHAMIIPS